MDENHDGKISQSEFVEVGGFHLCHFLRDTLYNNISLLCKNNLKFLSGVYGPEEVFNNIDIKNYRRVYNRRAPVSICWRKM